MKIRLDFVTNSSSSCFVISKEAITQEQLELLREKIKDNNCSENSWGIASYQSDTHYLFSAWYDGYWALAKIVWETLGQGIAEEHLIGHFGNTNPVLNQPWEEMPK